MRLLKPSWVSLDGHPIFSLDIHPDGSRFATGGQGDDCGRVVVWNMAPVASEEDEKDESIPKMLCQMDNHLACVNCVRWSNNGKYLSSGGDDKVIMIWQTSRGTVGSSSVFGGGGKMNVEQWRCVTTLRAHSGDILDIAWSPHDAWLASCSVDNSIIVWNALKLPEILSVLKGHSGLVKGVAWDPVGKYLASQSDDKTLKIWRTMDWKQETSISEPFEECGGTTHVLRLNWSPDGQFLVSAHAMNNSGPTAQIIEREGWRTEKDFVGHRKAITSVRFNPNILLKQSKDSGKVQHYCCCAIGSRDRSLSIWLTSLKRPLVVIHDLFSNSVLDIAWSRSGQQVMVCSWDGTVAFLDFTEEEIGKPLSQDEKSMFHQKMYGKSLAMNSHQIAAATVIENPEMLKLKEKQEQELETNSQQNTQDSTKSVFQAKGPLNRQIETRTPDGRRRITPMFIAPAPDLGEIPQPFSSRAQPIFSSSSESRSKIIIEKHEEPAAPTCNNLPAKTPATLTAPTTTVTVTAASTTCAVSTAVTPKSPEVAKVVTTTAASSPLSSSEKPKVSTPTDKETPVDKVDKAKEAAMKMKMTEVSMANKKKIDLRVESSKVAKRGPGRPPLSEKLGQMPPVVTQMVPKDSVKTQPHTVVVACCANPDLKLPAILPEKFRSLTVSFGKNEPPLTLEIENDIQLASEVMAHKLKCCRSGALSWEVMLPTKCCMATGSRNIVAVVCDDCTMSVFSNGGRRLLPSLMLLAQTSRLLCNGPFVLVLTTTGHVSVWDMKRLKVKIKSESLFQLIKKDTSVSNVSLCDSGCPVVSLSTGRSYTFSSDLGTWMLVHNPDDVNAQCADLQSHGNTSAQSSSRQSPTLSSLKSSAKKSSSVAHRLLRNNPVLQTVSNLCHLDYQMVAAQALHSGAEFRFWLHALVRYLVQEGMEVRLRELCDSLLGPAGPSSKFQTDFNNTGTNSNTWDSHIVGMHKHDLLREILPTLGSNLRLQRLYMEYQEQLETNL